MEAAEKLPLVPRWHHLAGRVGHRLLSGYMSRLRSGELTVLGPGGCAARFGDPTSSLRATLRIERPRFFWRVLAGGDVGFGESFVDGDWHCDDLTSLIRIFAENRDAFAELDTALSRPRHWLRRAYHFNRRNTLAGNRRNIRDHYDLGNEFFELFLDPSMTYSCGIYPASRASLEEGQALKIRTVLDKAQIGPSMHLLEIGSGWGSFAIAAARKTGCRVTTITLSEQQRDLVRARVAAAGLIDRVDVRLCDYRRMEGTYDRIVSIEMLEAVGHENLGTFFATCERLLGAGGRAVVQVITIRDDLYDEYRQGCDFIQRHIFPGGHLPSWQALETAIRDSSRLAIENVENIGHHYARTLRQWRERFTANAEDVVSLGFDTPFLRKWIYYFSYCEAGFATRTLGDVHIVLSK